MEDEYRISEKDDGKFIRCFAFVFIAFSLYMFVATGFEWTFSIFLIVAVSYFPYHLTKVKEAYYKNDCLAIKTNAGFTEIPLAEIAKVNRSSLVQRCYKVEFRNRTKHGKHIVLAPRRVGLLRKHKSFKHFIKAVNENT
ncbi:hypothetical protein [Zooshikella ganghwensis]|uniref:Uncharacterized protein n=1 Tax=Zooshikella ganghwensis TaxID=202772 RepID=A0A4V1INH1_9GAMM|nr:hypothetical protein [Zooshikella ganghwensis]RDH43711.1 hypothetical protein B9G39_09810 [Zooshikella ganghwensis]